MMDHSKKIRDAARKLLKDKRVKCVIGYASGADGMATPCFIRNPGDADSLIWNSTCYHNLVRYLADMKSADAKKAVPDNLPVGIVVKGCDSRALTILLQERFIEREEVFIIGVSCGDSGMSNRQGVLETRCLQCKAAAPVIYDVLIGEDVPRKVSDPYASLAPLEAMSAGEKWHFWKKEFDKCIRCYACRSICPMCYCDECVVDTIKFSVTAKTSAEEKAGKIKWIERAPSTSDNAVFHLVRATHLAGRCVDCGECDRACPVAIPLRLLNKKMEKEAVELFGYEAGFDPSKPSLVSCFKEEDPEDFIK